MYGRRYQTTFADRIRNEVGIATMAVGAIYEPDHVTASSWRARADLCALARTHLATRTGRCTGGAARLCRDAGETYLSGKAQLERNLLGRRRP